MKTLNIVVWIKLGFSLIKHYIITAAAAAQNDDQPKDLKAKQKKESKQIAGVKSPLDTTLPDFSSLLISTSTSTLFPYIDEESSANGGGSITSIAKQPVMTSDTSISNSDESRQYLNINNKKIVGAKTGSLLPDQAYVVGSHHFDGQR